MIELAARAATQLITGMQAAKIDLADKTGVAASEASAAAQVARLVRLRTGVVVRAVVTAPWCELFFATLGKPPGSEPLCLQRWVTFQLPA